MLIYITLCLSDLWIILSSSHNIPLIGGRHHNFKDPMNRSCDMSKTFFCIAHPLVCTLFSYQKQWTYWVPNFASTVKTRVVWNQNFYILQQSCKLLQQLGMSCPVGLGTSSRILKTSLTHFVQSRNFVVTYAIFGYFWVNLPNFQLFWLILVILNIF